MKGRSFNPNKKWLQPKQLMLIPVRVAVALQDDGWILRNDIIWHKPNPMPSSVKDRLNNTFEHVFHFVKSRKYYYDLDVIREPHKSVSLQRVSQNLGNPVLNTDRVRGHPVGADTLDPKQFLHEGGKNPGDILDIKEDCKSKQYSKFHHGDWDYHKDGKNPGDVVGAKYRGQDVNPSEGHIRRGKELHDAYPPGYNGHPDGKNPGDFWDITTKPFTSYNRDLEHFAVFPKELVLKPLKASCPSSGVVLDPFCGRGTVGRVARELGFDYVLFDLNPDYVELACLYVNGQKRKLIRNQRRLDN